MNIMTRIRAFISGGDTSLDGKIVGIVLPDDAKEIYGIDQRMKNITMLHCLGPVAEQCLFPGVELRMTDEERREAQDEAFIQMKRDLSLALRSEVYKHPSNYDREKIGYMLALITRYYPDEATLIVQEGFERAVEESGTDVDTRIIDQFLEHGASVHWAHCLRKAVQALEISPVHSQTVQVIRQLILAGADPDAAWPELNGLSVREVLASDPHSQSSLAALEAGHEAALLISNAAKLDTDTVQAGGASKVLRL